MRLRGFEARSIRWTSCDRSLHACCLQLPLSLLSLTRSVRSLDSSAHYRPLRLLSTSVCTMSSLGRSLLPANPLHRFCWSTLPVAVRHPAGPISTCALPSRRLTSTRALSTSASTCRHSTASTGWPHAAVWLSVLAAGVWLTHSTVSADAPPRAINSKAALARQVNRAAAMGDITSLRRLLEDNPSPDTANLPHPSGWTPLHAAAANGHEEAVQLLLEYGADVNARDKYALNRRNLSTELLRSRSEFQAAINPRISCTGWTPLHYGDTTTTHVQCSVRQAARNRSMVL